MTRHRRPGLVELPRPDTALVSVGSWEFGCCAPPVVVGELTTWRLGLHQDETRGHPTLRTDLTWDIQAWPTPTGPFRRLDRGGLSAVHEGHPALPTGRHVASGWIHGTMHGGGNTDDFPTTTAQVTWLWLVTSTYPSEPTAPLTLTPVRRSPDEWPGSRDGVSGLLMELS